MIKLEKVSEKTFKQVVDMRLPAEQNCFVAPNVVSLAQAWLYYEDAIPMAILNDDVVVGFMMLDWDEDERSVGIWRFMIATQYQGKGYGRQAMLEAIKFAKANGNIDMMHLDYVPGNDIAKKLYDSLGFKENGEIEDGEIVMTMPLTDKPQVGLVTADTDDLEELSELITENVFKTALCNEKLEKLIDEKLLIRITLMAKTIGLAFEDNILLLNDYQKYYDEANNKLKNKN